MQRVTFIAVTLVAGLAAPAPADTLPPPKGTTVANHGPAADGEAGLGRAHKHCHFLCDLYLLNCTGTKVKVWIRATLLCYPGLHVDVPCECAGKALIAHPCCAPWHLWFDKIKIGVWDGDQCRTIAVPFNGPCCQRRFVIEYDHLGELQVVER